jgi:hypothetical protein
VESVEGGTVHVDVLNRNIVDRTRRGKESEAGEWWDRRQAYKTKNGSQKIANSYPEGSEHKKAWQVRADELFEGESS